MGNSEVIDLFLTCIDQEGGLDEDRYAATCRERPSKVGELASLRADFEAGAGTLSASARHSFEGLTHLQRDLARYRLDSEVGRGGMGVVYRAWDSELRRTVAVKVLRKSEEGADGPRSDSGARLRLMEEAQILGQLQHPGIVPIYELGQDDEVGLFFTMPLVEGENLDAVIERSREPGSDWTEARLLPVLLRVCEAVTHAHSHGVLHRDLKPHNVMVGPMGETYVMDWGLAKVLGAPAAGDSASTEAPGHADSDRSSSGVSSSRTDLARRDGSSPLLSQVGQVVGTPAYMAPEQAAGRIDLVDERTDVFSLGALLYHVVTGSAPFSAASESGGRDALLRRVRSEGAPPIHRLRPDVPDELAAICEKAMQPRREDRYGSAAEMGEDLRSYLEGRVVLAYRTGAWIELSKWIRRHRKTVALLALVLVLLISAAIGFGTLWRRSEGFRRAATAAQVDSLRRQSVGAPMVTAAPAMPSFVDSFDDGALDRRWTVSHPDLVRESGGALRIRIEEPNEAVKVRTDRYVSVLRGDFDLTLDYRLEGFDLPSMERGERIASVEVQDAVAGGLIVSVGRRSERNPMVCDGVEQTYRGHVRGSQKRYCRPASGVSGRLRITREGDRFRSFHWDEGWQESVATTYDASAVSVLLLGCNWYEERPFVFEITELEIETDPSTSLYAVEDFVDEFDDGRLDSRLVLRGDAGIVAELDGRLHLEKAPGRTGHVAVHLDATRWKLTGDWEVGFEFELVEFPPPPVRAVLALRVKTPSGTPFGYVEVHQTPERRLIKASYHDLAKRIPAEGVTAMRVRKVGSSLFYEYRLDGAEWATLLERPHIDRDMDFSFSVDLTALTSDERYLALLDRLTVTRLSAR